MVCKNDVIAWFKNLKSYKRVDVMSSLLQLCMPFELRFLGTCLEDLAKRDFQELRQTENEANNLAELSTPETQSLANKDGRIKLALYVSLLHSCNEACASTIFKILTKDDINSVLKLALTDDNVLEELLSIYTIAVNHPAFSFDQKLELDKIFLKLQEEENRLVDQNVYKNKQNFPLPNIQDAMLEKPPPPSRIQSYQPCIGPEEQFQPCYVTSPMGPPRVPPQPHPPATLLAPKAFIYGEPFVGEERRMGLVGWPGAVAMPVSSDGSPGSRASSPCQSPSPPPGAAQRRSPPHPRPHPVRDTINKEMPTYSNRLHEYSPDQLKSMNDDELKEMGLPPKAIGQLKAILSSKPLVLPTANGVPHPPVHVLPQQPPPVDPRKKPPELMMRAGEMAMAPGVSCDCWGAARPPRGESSSGGSDSASDHSPPDTPDPRHVPPPHPHRPHMPRAHPPPHHSMMFRRRDGMANGVPDDRKIYTGNGGVEAATSYFSPQGWCQPYPLRAAPYAPFPFPVQPRPPPPSYPFPNGEVVYSAYYPYPAHPPLPPAKLSCYNCGSPTHAPPDCPESTMEEITKQGQYRIDYNKQQQIASAPVQPPQPTPPDPSVTDK